MRIGEIIREAREKNNISLEELAKYIDKSKSTINMLERYNVMPNFDTACMLCEVLGLDIKTVWDEIRKEYIKKNKIKIISQVKPKIEIKEKARGSPGPG